MLQTPDVLGQLIVFASFLLSNICTYGNSDQGKHAKVNMPRIPDFSFCALVSKINLNLQLSYLGSAVPLAMFTIFAARWRQFYWFQICSSYKFGHQEARHALPYCLRLPYWHSVSVELVSSSARVTSFKSQRGVGVTTRSHRSDPRLTWVQ